MKCIKNVHISDNDCLNKCDGLFITGVDRREFEKNQVEDILSQVEDDYEKFKTGANLKYLSSIGGNCNLNKYFRMEKQPTNDFNLF